MKFKFYNISFIIANLLTVLAQDNELSEGIGGGEGGEGGDFDNFFEMSPECTGEIAKYTACPGISYLMNNESPDYKNFCSLFEDDTCKTFVEDVSVTTSVCLNTKDNFTDLMSGMMILSSRINYLFICSKDSNNNLCPFSDYIVKNPALFDENNEDTEIPDDAKKTIVNDCKDTKCNERMVNIYELTKVLLELSDKMGVDDNGNENVDNPEGGSQNNVKVRNEDNGEGAPGNNPEDGSGNNPEDGSGNIPENGSGNNELLDLMTDELFQSYLQKTCDNIYNLEPTNDNPVNDDPNNSDPTNGEQNNDNPSSGEKTNGEQTNDNPSSGEKTTGEQTNDKPSSGDKTNDTTKGTTSDDNKSSQDSSSTTIQKITYSSMAIVFAAILLLI